MKIKELIDKENLKRKINNPVVIFITYKYQGNNIIKPFNMYYANILPITYDEFIKEFKKYGNYYFDEYNPNKITLNTKFNEEDFQNFINKDFFPSLFGTYCDGNRLKKYQICNSEAVVFPYEATEVTKERFDELVKVYNHIPDLKNLIESDIKHTYTFKSEEERDIYGHALLDGLTETEAYGLMLGVAIDFNKIPYIGGYYDLQSEYKEYFNNIFGV